MNYYFMTNVKTHKDYIFKAESLKTLAEKLGVKIFGDGSTAFGYRQYTDWLYTGMTNYIDPAKVNAIPA